MTKKVLIITDAWTPQINGVVNVLVKTVELLRQHGFEVHVFHPQMFKHFSLSNYKDIPISYGHITRLNKLITALNPDYIHIATEGTLGNSARHYCIKNNIDFTTAYHTRYPEYAKERFGIPINIGYLYMKWFHSKAKNVLVVSDVIRKELAARGFTNLVPWSLGVDTELFNPNKRIDYGFKYVLYVGRVTPEKNVDAFLKINLDDIKKVVVGQGNELGVLKTRYPDAFFLGVKEGNELATCYASAEAFCFPSKTETFGLVMIEALSSGIPVAAFDVPQIMEVINTDVGATDKSLEEAVRLALKCKNSEFCRAYAVEHFSWEKSIDQFITYMQ